MYKVLKCCCRGFSFSNLIGFKWCLPVEVVIPYADHQHYNFVGPNQRSPQLGPGAAAPAWQHPKGRRCGAGVPLIPTFVEDKRNLCGFFHNRRIKFNIFEYYNNIFKVKFPMPFFQERAPPPSSIKVDVWRALN